MNEYALSVNSLSSKLDRLESILNSRKVCLGTELVNDHGVIVKEGGEIGVFAKVMRVGTDRDGKHYAIIDVDGNKIKVGLNQIVDFQRKFSF